MMCSDTEMEDEEETRLRQKLQKQLVIARETLETKVRPAARACFGGM